MQNILISYNYGKFIYFGFELRHVQGFPLFGKNIPFCKLNDPEICSGTIPDEMKTYNTTVLSTEGSRVLETFP